MGELNEWGKAIGNIIRSGGTTTEDPTPSHSDTDDDSDYSDFENVGGGDRGDDD